MSDQGKPHNFGQALFESLGQTLSNAPAMIAQAQEQKMNQAMGMMRMTQMRTSIRLNELKVMQLIVDDANYLSPFKVLNITNKLQEGRIKLTATEARETTEQKIAANRTNVLDLQNLFPDRKVGSGGMTIGAPPIAKLSPTQRGEESAIQLIAKNNTLRASGFTKDMSNPQKIRAVRSRRTSLINAMDELWQKSVPIEKRNQVGVSVIGNIKDAQKAISSQVGSQITLFGKSLSSLGLFSSDDEGTRIGEAINKILVEYNRVGSDEWWEDVFGQKPITTPTLDGLTKEEIFKLKEQQDNVVGR